MKLGWGERDPGRFLPGSDTVVDVLQSRVSLLTGNVSGHLPAISKNIPPIITKFTKLKQRLIPGKYMYSISFDICSSMKNVTVETHAFSTRLLRY